MQLNEYKLFHRWLVNEAIAWRNPVVPTKFHQRYLQNNYVSAHVFSLTECLHVQHY